VESENLSQIGVQGGGRRENKAVLMDHPGPGIAPLTALVL